MFQNMDIVKATERLLKLSVSKIQYQQFADSQTFLCLSQFFLFSDSESLRVAELLLPLFSLVFQSNR